MPVIGPIGVVVVRQFISATVFFSIAKPRWRELDGRTWAAVIGLGATLGTLSISVYAAIERIGLGLAVSIEFLGPLALAVLGSRRLIDFFGVVIAAIGVFVLVNPSPSSDYLGFGLAFIGALAWATYILLNHRVGKRLPGLEGTSAANVISLLVWAPVGVMWFSLHPPHLGAITLAVICGLLGSVVQYAADIAALRRISPASFSALASFYPVWAALIGWILLGQALELREWIGIVLIVGSNAIVTLAALHRS